jgi:sugar/nucleoside kinase (ribokinase family)|tara:strand:- start:8946 stop:9950 length:1005 start_codon:yes stop_codon:yes gene_type:complete
MKKINILGVGAALVDQQFSVEDSLLKDLQLNKGSMDLKDQETQDQTYKKLTHLYGSSKDACGGSSTNTVYAASILGSKCSFIGKVADDVNGNFYVDNLNKANIKNKCMSSDQGVSGNCLVMVSPDAERTMSTFLGISSELKISDLDEDMIKEAETVYLEAYLVSSDQCFTTTKRIIEIAQKNNTKIAISLSDSFIVSSFKDRLLEWMENEIDYLFCNEEEAKAFSNSETIENAEMELKKFSKTSFITLGKDGAIVVSENNKDKIDGFLADAIDTNGAGDMFAGAVLYKLSKGYENKISASFGCFLASKGVENFGPRLPDEDYIKNEKLFEKYKK